MTAGVFDPIELEWKGKSYTIEPTMRMLKEIERDVSVAWVSSELQEGRPVFSHISSIVAYLLRRAGAKHVADEDVFLALHNGDPETMQAYCMTVVMAFLPRETKKSGNDKAPAKAAGASSKSRGKLTTASQ